MIYRPEICSDYIPNQIHQFFVEELTISCGLAPTVESEIRHQRDSLCAIHVLLYSYRYKYELMPRMFLTAWFQTVVLNSIKYSYGHQQEDITFIYVILTKKLTIS
jgi:hypothetical protein